MAEKSKTATKARRKPTAKRKPAANRKPPIKLAIPKNTTSDLTTSAQDTGRKVFLAGLGFYGKAYDQAQEQFNILQKQLEVGRKKSDNLYKELVKRGEKLEKEAKGAIQDIDLPKFEGWTDRKKLTQHLKKAKARFDELKGSVRFKAAA